MPPGERPRAVRLAVLGAAGVGKSALIHRFLHNRFEHRYEPTVEELHVREYDTAACGRMRLEVLDTSGSYSFPAMRRLRIRHSDAFALVYAVDSARSFEEVRRLRGEILELRGGRRAPITVVGCKAELTEAEGRELLAAEAMAVVEGEWGDNFVEASARTGGNAAGVFRALLQQVNLPPSRGSDAAAAATTPPGRASRRRRPQLRKSHSCVVS